MNTAPLPPPEAVGGAGGATAGAAERPSRRPERARTVEAPARAKLRCSPASTRASRSACFAGIILLFHALYRLRDRTGRRAARPLADRSAAHRFGSRRYRRTTAPVGRRISRRHPKPATGAARYGDSGAVGHDHRRRGGRPAAPVPRGPAGRNSRRRAALAELGLQDPVDDATIKRRYRRLAMRHHPDQGRRRRAVARDQRRAGDIASRFPCGAIPMETRDLPPGSKAGGERTEDGRSSVVEPAAGGNGVRRHAKITFLGRNGLMVSIRDGFLHRLDDVPFRALGARPRSCRFPGPWS
jgi:DnaJ-domain-containing protein 1